MVRDGEDWLLWAQRWPIRQFERQVWKRQREIETGERVTTLTALLTSSGREKFERARKLACRKQNKVLSEGETVEVLSDHYLDSFDPERKTPRKRRMAETIGRTGRHVPASVTRAVIARQGDRCAVPGCDHDIFMNLAHILPHRRGGSREAWNIHYLCWQHHVLYDRGQLKIRGTPDRPVFHMPDGKVLEPVRAPP
jgi:predicted restriction endonuclease